METLIKEITDIHENRFQLLKNENLPKINWLSVCTPEEVIYAAKMIPYRITGETRPDFSKASSHMHRTICSYVLSCFEEVLDGVHGFASGTVIVNACDVRKKLFDVWKYFDRTTFLHQMDFPKLVTPLARKYYRQQIQQLVTALEHHFHCRITDESLKEAIQLCNQTRRLLAQLYDLRRQGRAAIPGSQAINIVKAAAAGLRRQFHQKLQQLIEYIEKHPQPNKKNDYRLLLCGSYFDHSQIANIFETYGANIICEDVSTGIKYFTGEVSLEGNPIEALADYYLEKATCARMTDAENRFNHIWKLVEDYQVQAVVYFSLKFCDNNLFDYPYQKNRLNEKGIPVFFIEAERSVENIEQIKTRIVAFLESHMGY